MTPAPTNQPSEFQNFQALARRILTTPKTELMKNAAKAKPTRLPAKKRK